jgi:hypothetical protein
MQILVLVTGLVASSVLAAFAQTAAERECLYTAHHDLQRLLSAFVLDGGCCLSDNAQGKLGGLTVEACLLANRKHRVRLSKRQAADNFRALCGRRDMTAADGKLAVAAADVVALIDAAENLHVSVLHEIFAANLDSVLAVEAGDASVSWCQREVFRAVGRCETRQLKTFNKCKRAGLNLAASGATAIATSAQLRDRCLLHRKTDGSFAGARTARACDLVVRAPGGQVHYGRIGTNISESCVSRGVVLADAFPGCKAADADTLHACIDARVRCHVCVALNTVDGLTADCDAFDDGSANHSCLRRPR